MELIKNSMLPSERALSAIKRWEKKLDLHLTSEEKVELVKSIIQELQGSIQEERDNTDKFIALSENENGVLEYYLDMLDKMKYMVGSVIVENSRKKRDETLIEIAKIIGANVVEEQIPHKVRLKQAV